VGIKIIDVWAEWCAPCKKFAPIFEALSKEHTDIEFEKINADENLDALHKYNIRGIPAIIFEKEGRVVRTHIGILSRGQMEEEIARLRYDEN
jgi:thioredoxin 1